MDVRGGVVGKGSRRSTSILRIMSGGFGGGEPNLRRETGYGCIDSNGNKKILLSL